MKLSVVTTLYKSRIFLDTFVKEILESIDELKIKDFELVFVNDGSPDDSMSFLLQKKKEIPEIIVIDLSRNFGHHYAIQAGLQYAKGDFIFLIDNDLETPPCFLETCYDKLQKDDSIDAVYGYQEVRKGKLVENIGGRIFWNLLNKLSDVEVPTNLLTERLMTRRYLDSLLKMGDANLFLGGLFYWIGYNQVGLLVDKKQRTGNSTYSFKRRLELMFQAITSFSGKPLEYLFYTGVFITISAIIVIVYFLIKKITYGDDIQLGWTSLVVLNVLILGIISTYLGIIGVYLFKIFRQTQNRPNYIIRNIY
jgi:putative glycosyltransferase